MDTQQTVLQETVDNNVVVAELTDFGISKKTAEKFSKDYPQDYLLEKLNLVQWLVETSSKLVGKNPPGYLRRAIEDDYVAPAQYESPVDRSKRREVERQRRHEAEEEFRKSRERTERLLRQQHPSRPISGTDLTTETAWAETLAKLETQISRPIYETWLKGTLLLEIDGDTAVVSVPNTFTKDWLERRMYQSMARELTNVLGREVDIEFMPAEELASEGLEDNRKAPMTA